MTATLKRMDLERRLAASLCDDYTVPTVRLPAWSSSACTAHMVRPAAILRPFLGRIFARRAFRGLRVPLSDVVPRFMLLGEWAPLRPPCEGLACTS